MLPFRYEDRRALRVESRSWPQGGPSAPCRSTVVDRAGLIRTRRRGFTIFEATVLGPTTAATIRGSSGTTSPTWSRVLSRGPSRRALRTRGGARTAREAIRSLENAGVRVPRRGGRRRGYPHGSHRPVYRKVGDLPARSPFEAASMHHALAELDPALLDTVIVAARGGSASHGLLGPLCRRCAADPLPAGWTTWLADSRSSERTEAQRSLAFEEIFLLQLAPGDQLRRQGMQGSNPGESPTEIPDTLQHEAGAHAAVQAHRGPAEACSRRSAPT